MNFKTRRLVTRVIALVSGFVSISLANPAVAFDPTIAALNVMKDGKQRLLVFNSPTPAQGEIGGPIAYDLSFGIAYSDTHVTDMAGIDINGDGIDEIAVFHRNAPRRILIFNPPTIPGGEAGLLAYDPQIGGSDFNEAKAIAGVDINGDGIDEVALLFCIGGTTGGQIIFFLNAPTPGNNETGAHIASLRNLGSCGGDGKIVSMAGVDIDGDGIDEIAVLNRMGDRRQRLAIFNSPTSLGETSPPIAYDTTFGTAWSDYHIVAIAGVDIDGDGIDEIAALNTMLNDNQRLVIFNAPTPGNNETGPPIAYDTSFGTANSDYHIKAIAGIHR